MKEARKKYEKLREKFKELPEFREILKLGIFEEGDFESVFSLEKAVKKSLLNLQGTFQEFLVPSDFVSMHDSKFLRDMRDEILEALTEIAYIVRRLSLKAFKAVSSNSPEENIAKAVAEAVRDAEKVIETYARALEVLEERWKSADIEEEEPNYRW